ncbi:DUF2278 family protein [Chlorobium limicola]|uniref:DUF2278 domain-containing protein n=1 Tax=Chlorobium limicola TaxID=1092 RepID=A0A101JEE8_CHLLI|nr:DUF2278 family protein [Chlorobium limicola]KUL25238.1 hypothetical protein ASB62_06755 [Chlorobium limicola]
MPLKDGYGVLAGTLHSYSCDRIKHDKQYYHCNIRIKAGPLIYRCPVDLDNKKSSDGIQWRVVEMGRTSLKGISGLRDGWHALRSNPHSGALDYYRSPELAPTDECRLADDDAPDNVMSAPASGCIPWRYGIGAAAFRDLEPLLKHARRLYVFGEPFRNGKGVHNIHQNQGDPPDSQWVGENGIWQDGCVVAERWNHTVAAFLCKFKSQRFITAVEMSQFSA